MRDSPLYAFVERRKDGFVGWRVPTCPFCGHEHIHADGLGGRVPHCHSVDLSHGQSEPCPGRLNFNDPEYQADSEGMILDDSPLRVLTREVAMVRGEVRLHRDGEQFAVSTNAETERDFLDGMASALASQDCGAGELAKWLPLIVDVTCKMRGYKADVQEKRVIIAGSWLPNDHAAVVGTAKVEKEIVTA